MIKPITTLCLISLTSISSCYAASNASGYLKQTNITLQNDSNHSIYVVSHLAGNHDSNGHQFAIRCLQPQSPQQFSWLSIPLDNHTTVVAQGLIIGAHQSASMHFDNSKPICNDHTSVADSLATYSSTPKSSSLIDDDLNFQFYDTRVKAISFYADVFANPSNISLDTEHSIIHIQA